MARKVWAGTQERPVVAVEDGRTLLRVGGVIQSVAVDERHEPDFWDAMLPHTRPAQTLLLGLGGGTIAALLTCRFGPVPILGVERDPRIIAIARERFGLGDLPHVQIVEADAFAFLARYGNGQRRESGGDGRQRFDLICVDLYVAGRMEHGVLGGGFLRDLSAALAPGGTVSINLWNSRALADQLRRIQRVLALADVAEVGQNVIVRCTHRPLVTVLPH